ncbi:MAG TPA: hypothetical protein ENK57_09015 [Polyangiaceae bacterium]|nr:hypothetical protein [Polyangiaceae bacterium]
MDESRFEELALDPTRWTTVARKLRIAAGLLGETESAELWGHVAHTDEDLAIRSWERWVAAISGCGILLAYAVENACKARSIRDGDISVKNGQLRGLRSDHHLVEMLRQLKVVLSVDEAATLERLTADFTGLEHPSRAHLITGFTVT